MIKAVIKYHDNLIHEFEITGHADSGPYGQDIVCSAVSVLSISTVNGLSQVAHVNATVEQNQADGGFLKVVLPLNINENQLLKSQTLLLSFQNGLRDIEKNYDKYLKLIIKR